MIISENTLIGKLKRLISRSVILQSILFSVFAFLVFLALWNQDVWTHDEPEMFIKGQQIMRGGLLYKDVDSQHMPLMYHLSAVFARMGFSGMAGFRAAFFAHNISCGSLACNLALLSDKVNKIVYVKNIAAGEYSLVICFSVFINYRAVCDSVKPDSGVFGELVFGYKTDREQKRIALNCSFRPGDGAAVFVNACNRNTCDAVFTLDIYNRGAEIQRNVKVVETLDYVSCKSA